MTWNILYETFFIMSTFRRWDYKSTRWFPVPLWCCVESSDEWGIIHLESNYYLMIILTKAASVAVNNK